MSQTAGSDRKPAREPLVALTGATGFIGQYLLNELPKRGYRLRVLLRRPTNLPKGCASAVIGDLARPYYMAEALAEAGEPQPTDAYGRSKLAAEQGLAATDLDWVALRLALVYGPGVEGNMARLIKLARSPYPLPLAGLKTEHSLLGLDNLVEAVDKVLAAEAPLKRPLIVADPKPLTIAAMIAALRQGLGRRAALFYVPKPLLRGALRAAGLAETCAPLFGSLVADPSALSRLNWVPPIETAAGLAALLRNEASA